MARLDWRALGQDFRYALRGLRRTRVFTAIAVLTLGCGIGVTMAVFTVVNATLLKPLPYDRPEQLVELVHVLRAGTPGEVRFGAVTWREFDFWRAQRQLFAGLEGHDRTDPPLQWPEGGRSIQIGRFTPGLPALLGVAPLRGRLFTESEADSKAAVLLISEELWTRDFGRRSETIGATMTLGKTAFTIVGVMPSDFRYGPPAGSSADVWSGLPARGMSATPNADLTMAIARLQDDVSVAAANATSVKLAEPIRSQLASAPPFDQPWIPEVQSLNDWRRKANQAPVSSPLLFLLGTGALVLLVACANVANLFAARGLARRDELIVRSALGASRARLARLLIVEGTVLTLFAATCGMLVAAVGVSAALAMMPARLFQSLFEAGTPALDWRVAGFAVALSGLVAVVASAWPAIRYSRVQLSASGGRIAWHKGRGVATTLQAFQIALALLIVIGAGLLSRSFSAVANADVGFDLERLGVLSLTLPGGSADELLATVKRVPGVQSVALGSAPTSTGSSYFFEVEGQPAVRKTRIDLRSGIGPGYFKTVGARIVNGREFGPEDSLGAAEVAIIDQTTASRLFGEESAIGRRFRFRPDDPFLTVIGVVTDAVVANFVSAGRTLGVYTPWGQRPGSRPRLVVRTDSNVATVMGNVRREVESIYPDAEITAAEPATLAFDRAETYVRPRFMAALVSIFALLALLTAAVGLYGLLSFSVGQRQREIGVRIALGSTMTQIRRLLIGAALRPLIAGLAIGWVAALLSMRFVAALLYGVKAYDWITFATAGAVMVVAALVATIGPMRRATRIDPISSLRAD